MTSYGGFINLVKYYFVRFIFPELTGPELSDTSLSCSSKSKSISVIEMRDYFFDNTVTTKYRIITITMKTAKEIRVPAI